MGLSDVARINITAGTRGITRQGFGTMSIVAHNFPAAIANRKSIAYSTDTEMAQDGFPAMHPARILANHIFKQQVKKLPIKVLNLRDTSTVTVITLSQWSPVFLPVGKVFRITIKHATQAAEQVIAVTILDTWDIDDLFDALETAINALAITGLTASANTGPSELVISSTLGNMIHVDMDTLGTFFLKHLDESLASGSIGTALDDILIHDPDFYGMVSAHTSSAQIQAIGAWAEINGRRYAARTADSDVATGTAPNVAKELVADDLAGSFTVYHPVHSDPLAAGLLASELSKDPGKSHNVYKQVRGSAAPPDFIMSTANRNAMAADMVTYNVKEAGVVATRGGKVAAGEWFDIIRLIDFFRSRLAEDIYFVQLANDKIAYTIGGIRSIVSVIEGRFTSKIGQGISPDSPIIVTAPEPQEVDSTDKIDRFLPGVEFSAPLEGAILLVEVTGSLTV